MEYRPEPAPVRIDTSSIHGRGAFALRHLPAGMPVVEYRGERVSKEESRRRCAAGNPFLFALDDTTDLDGAVEDNPARYLNHSCHPNCEARLLRGGIWMVALRDIPAGEELTFNYGYDLTEWRSHPCRCGAADCVGYMVAEEFFPQIRRLREHLEPPDSGGS